MPEASSDGSMVTLRTGTFWKKDGVLYGRSADGAEETLADAEEQLAAQRLMLDGGRPMPFIMDIRPARGLSREARNLFSGESAREIFSATALIVGSPLSRTLGNFFLGLNKTRMPTRLFSSEEEALAWLRSNPAG